MSELFLFIDNCVIALNVAFFLLDLLLISVLATVEYFHLVAYRSERASDVICKLLHIVLNLIASCSVVSLVVTLLAVNYYYYFQYDDVRLLIPTPDGGSQLLLIVIRQFLLFQLPAISLFLNTCFLLLLCFYYYYFD